jgi:uncharacterized heparinase superfamily protein
MGPATALARAGLYWRTSRNLRARQLAYFVLRRLLPDVRGASVAAAGVASKALSLAPSIAASSESGAADEFRFLNRSVHFAQGKVDWASQSMPKLWRYNLHYFDYLHDCTRSDRQKCQLLSDWVANNPPGHGDGWEPYTVSLRIVNWIKLFSITSWRGALQQSWLDSLYEQAHWLARNIEYHILANHYLKNGKALFFAGAFFEGGQAAQWQKKGREILLEEADEQLLGDGGHYERSPMYHCIVMEDYLDVINVAQHNTGLLADTQLDHLLGKTRAGLAFIDDLSFSPERFPLFNDAAFGIAPTPKALRDYADRLGCRQALPTKPGLGCIAKVHSGYYVIRDAEDMMVIDCGAVGPAYQPGHAHCDTLSYELMLEGRAVVVDSGVHDYEDGALRAYVRSTRAHNTVMVDGAEQSEIWGVFRVARRAAPLSAELLRTSDTRACFTGSHDGYRQLAGGVVHQRRVDYSRTAGWTITDVLLGCGEHSAESYVHIHPDLAVASEGDDIVLFDESNTAVARIKVAKDTCRVRLERGWYCPQFGSKFENSVIVFAAQGALPFEMSYQIIKV